MSMGLSQGKPQEVLNSKFVYTSMAKLMPISGLTPIRADSSNICGYSVMLTSELSKGVLPLLIATQP